MSSFSFSLRKKNAKIKALSIALIGPVIRTDRTSEMTIDESHFWHASSQV